MATPPIKPKVKALAGGVVNTTNPPTVVEQVTSEGEKVATPTVAATTTKPKHIPVPFDAVAFKAKFNEKSALQPKPLFLVLTGKRSSGKSGTLGTCDGDLLLIHSRQEHHSYQTAVSINLDTGNPYGISPMYFDQTDDGVAIDAPEKVWNYLSDRMDGLIATPDIAKIFPYIAIDSLYSLERYTIARDNVLKASTFKQTQEATANLMEFVLKKLLVLHGKGCNIIVTLPSEVKERPDGSLNVTPALTGYRTADEVLGSFPDIAVVNCIVAENEQGNMQEYYVLQFKNAEGTKTGKKMSGEVVTTTFNPRLQSLPRHLLPEYLEANIGGLQKFIKDTFAGLGKPAISQQ